MKNIFPTKRTGSNVYLSSDEKVFIQLALENFRLDNTVDSKHDFIKLSNTIYNKIKLIESK